MIIICNKDYSAYADILRYRDKNPDRRDHNRFDRDEVDRLWQVVDQPYSQIVLMLIYNGCRISEFLDLKKENINLEEQYFDVVSSKTENGIRRVPIANKVLPFYQEWYESSDCEYLLHTPEHKHFDYCNISCNFSFTMLAFCYMYAAYLLHSQKYTNYYVAFHSYQTKVFRAIRRNTTY